MEVLKSINTDKRDIVKASVAVETVQEHANETVVLTGIIIAKKWSDDEQRDVEVTALKLQNGTFITSISKTVKDSAETMLNAFEENEFANGLEIVIKSKKSKGGRDFFYLDLA